VRLGLQPPQPKKSIFSNQLYLDESENENDLRQQPYTERQKVHPT
jgi:hypothetical protein